jgi:hypothetical protein
MAMDRRNMRLAGFPMLKNICSAKDSTTAPTRTTIGK